MPELPDHLDLSVTLDGEPLAGAWVEMRLPMERKNDYLLMLGPTDVAGQLALTRADLEDQIAVIQLSGFMDYTRLGVWRGELELAPCDAAAISRAQARQQAWSPELLKVYPAGLSGQLSALAQRLAAQPGRPLELSAQPQGGSAHITCLTRSS